MEFKISEDFIAHANAVLTRLHYLYPDLKITFKKNIFSVDIDIADQNIKLEKELKKEIFHQLYRAKIYEDTLPIKKWLFSDN